MLSSANLAFLKYSYTQPAFSAKKLDLGLRLFMQKPSQQNGLTKMDIRPLDPKDWLVVDNKKAFRSARRNKATLASRYPEHVYVAQDANVQSQELPFLRHIAARLAVNNPRCFEYRDDRLVDKTTSRELSLNSLPAGQSPLNIAARMSHEDFVLLKADSEKGPHRFWSAAFYHPSAWSPKSKLGQTMAQVHEPVGFNTTSGRATTLNTEIGKAIDSMLVRLSPDRPLWRMNMLFARTASMFRNPDVSSSMAVKTDQLTADDIGRQLFLRLEHQGFTKLPESGDVLFSVRTFVYPFQNLPKEVKGHTRSILETTCSSTGMTIARFLKSSYKGWSESDVDLVQRYLLT